ncbi:WbqC family protein [Candidatus Sulfidibacterium hydrothermale]|uniref:WbqC family protein n=1 Tax=Candidatus Sulfidibacterium hydrothermale TaxID=2875962 RepID=UPI001F0B106E|nr:WbqC family protein [Candidatus Sulfidibacterium hydrothermale]UBM61674.1 WbqC family protein [Candidatus Sulfidibacterium hydrothermale]
MVHQQNPILLSTAWFPPAGWFSLLPEHPVLIEAFETYPKQTYRNRCHIFSERGVLPLSVPVKQPKGHHTPITEVTVFNDEKWFLKHWRAIHSAYQGSPYFLYYADEIKPFFSGEFDNLFQMNRMIIEKLCELIEIPFVWQTTSYFEKQVTDASDFRDAFSPKKKQEGIFPEYVQVFSDRHPFQANLSILDVLFNLGPETKDYLSRIRLFF